MKIKISRIKLRTILCNSQETQLKKMREYMKENAERKVKADLVIEAIAKAEEIEATEEEIKAKAIEVAKNILEQKIEKMVELLVKSQRE